MNRIQISPLALSPSSKNSNPSQVADKFTPYQVTTPHRIFIPVHFEQNYAYPLIVWFHSAGDDTEQMLRVIPSISVRNFVAVAPQGPTGNRHQGFFWPQDGSSIEAAHRLTVEAIEMAKTKAHIAEQRIFLAGYGTGGTMALRIALRLPDQIAGCVSINGALPQGHNPLGNLKSCRQVPFLWAHCQKSIDFPEQALCDQLKLLHVSGFNVTVRQYPFGDELPALALHDANRWIMESFTSTVS